MIQLQQYLHHLQAVAQVAHEHQHLVLKMMNHRLCITKLNTGLILEVGLLKVQISQLMEEQQIPH